MANQTVAATSAEAAFPRWIPLLGGVLGSSVCGLLLYAASIFNAPLMKEFGLTNREVSLFFAVCCLTFGLVTFPAGRFSDKVGPRKVVLVGGAILTVGYICCGFVTAFWQYVLLFGVVSGFGGGCIYLPPIATAPKWWPDRRALATGFTVVGLGLGSFTMGPLGNWIIKTMSTAGTTDGWRYVHFYVGILMGVMTLLCVMCLKVPPAGYKPAGWNPPAPKPGAVAAGRDFTHEESRGTSQFWMLYTSYFCGSFAGLMVIGFLKPIGMDGLKSAFSDPKVAGDYAHIRDQYVCLCQCGSAGTDRRDYRKDRHKEVFYLSLFSANAGLGCHGPGGFQLYSALCSGDRAGLELWFHVHVISLIHPGLLRT